MSKLKKLFSIMILGVLLVVNVIPVNAVEDGDNKLINSLTEADLGEHAQFLVDEGQTNNNARVAAPALTSFKLYAIYSEKAGEEIISSSSSSVQVGSGLDHGGTWFQAITIETGYAKTSVATHLYLNNNSSNICHRML